MRRFWAFMAMVVSLLVLVVFNVQAVYESNNLSLEYQGGTEVVLQLTQRENGETLDGNLNDLSTKITKRLDAAGARNSEVEIVMNGENSSGLQLAQARISLSPASSNELTNITRVLKANTTLTFSTANDFVVTGTELQGDRTDVMEMKYSGTTSTPVFCIGSSEAFTNLKNDAANNSDENLKKNIYVWENKATTDTYELAFGDKARADVKAKIIATLSVDDYKDTDKNDLFISVSKDEDGNAFTTASARSYMEARNSDDYGFDVKYLYDNIISASYSSNSLMLTYIGAGVSLALLLTGAILLYGVSGAVSGLSIAVGTLFLVMIANFVGFELTPATILAVMVTIILGVFINCNFFQRVKDEMKKGKSIDSAGFEGYKKSFAVTFQSCLLAFFLGLFAFLLGKGMIRVFGAIVFMGAVTDFLFVNYLTRWMEYWLTTSPVFAKNGRAFGLDANANFIEKKVENKKLVAQEKVKGKRKLGIGLTSGVGLLVLASFLAFGLLSHSGAAGFFNNSGDYKDSYRLNIDYVTLRTVSDDKTFVSFDDFYSNLVTDSNIIDGDKIVSHTFNRLETQDEEDVETYTTYVSVELSESLTDAQKDNISTYIKGIEIKGHTANLEDVHVEGNVVKSGEIIHNNYYFYLVVGLTAVFAFAFYLLMYGIYASLAVASVETLEFGLGFGLLSASRLPFNSTSMFAILAAVIATSFSVLPIFSRYRELKRDAKIKKADMPTRIEMMDRSMKLSVTSVTVPHAALVLAGICFIAFGYEQLLTLGLLLIVLSLFSYFLVLSLLSYFYLQSVTLLTFKHHRLAIKDPKTLLKAKEFNKNEPHETVVPGIND
jgi:preprotein translocase subunit SecD